MRRLFGMVLVSLALVACSSSTSTRNTRDPSEDSGGTDGGEAGKPPANAGPFQVEEAAKKGPPQVVITNGTEETVNVEFEGPNASKMSIPPGDTQAFTSSAGIYSLTMSDPAGARDATTLAGVELENDWIYTWTIRLKSPE